MTISALLKQTTPDRIIALARDPARADELAGQGIEVRRFDYDAPADLAASLAGIERLLLISSDDVVGRVEQHRAVIDAAVAAEVGFIAYTSVLHADTNSLSVAPSHRATEAMLRGSGISHAILRNGWYTENYLIGADVAIAHGVLLGSSGAGRISAAARADYADAGAAVLVAGRNKAGIHELAGDESFDLSDVAAALTHASGRQVTYHDLPEAAYAQALGRSGMPPSLAGMLAGLSAGASSGILEDDSRALSNLIGRPTARLGDIVDAAIGKART
jgi:NAD(P)H dehydrogenase (quinone)